MLCCYFLIDGRLIGADLPVAKILLEGFCSVVAGDSNYDPVTLDAVFAPLQSITKKLFLGICAKYEQEAFCGWITCTPVINITVLSLCDQCWV